MEMVDGEPPFFNEPSLHTGVKSAVYGCPVDECSELVVARWTCGRWESW